MFIRFMENVNVSIPQQAQRVFQIVSFRHGLHIGRQPALNRRRFLAAQGETGRDDAHKRTYHNFTGRIRALQYVGNLFTHVCLHRPDIWAIFASAISYLALSFAHHAPILFSVDTIHVWHIDAVDAKRVGGSGSIPFASLGMELIYFTNTSAVP